MRSISDIAYLLPFLLLQNWASYMLQVILTELIGCFCVQSKNVCFMIPLLHIQLNIGCLTLKSALIFILKQ